jgi:hypothetical protein
MKINISDLDFKIKLTDKDEMPAIVTFVVGQFEIRGFTIRRTKFKESIKRFVLYPPANRVGINKWIKIFWTEDKEEWAKIEDTVLEKFNTEFDENYFKTLGKEVTT